MEVIAQQLDSTFLVQDGEKFFTVDIDEGTVFEHQSVEVVLKWGYWFEVTADADTQKQALALARGGATK